MRVLSNIFTLRGRIDRAQYAAALAASWGVMLTPQMILPAEGVWADAGLLAPPAFDAAAVPMTVGVALGLAVQIVAGWRRAHDMNMTGWAALGSLILISALPLYVLMLTRGGTPGPNRYGEPPADDAAPAMIN